MQIRKEREGADLEVLIAKVLLIGGAEIGRRAVDRSGVGTGAKGSEKGVAGRPVQAGFGVDVRVPPGIGGCTERVAGKCARNERTCGWRGAESGARVGKAPGGRRIPGVLNCRRVVEAEAYKHVGAPQGQIIDGAKIEIVPGDSAADAVIGELREAAEMIVDTARDEKIDLVDRHVVVRRIVRRGRSGLILVRV